MNSFGDALVDLLHVSRQIRLVTWRLLGNVKVGLLASMSDVDGCLCGQGLTRSPWLWLPFLIPKLIVSILLLHLVSTPAGLLLWDFILPVVCSILHQVYSLLLPVKPDPKISLPSGISQQVSKSGSRCEHSFNWRVWSWCSFPWFSSISRTTSSRLHLYLPSNILNNTKESGIYSQSAVSFKLCHHSQNNILALLSWSFYKRHSHVTHCNWSIPIIHNKSYTTCFWWCCNGKEGD